jgi:hypothetical protein
MQDKHHATLEGSMIRKIPLLALVMSMAVSFVSAEVDFENGKGLNIKEELANIEVPTPSASQVNGRVQDKGIVQDIWNWVFGEPPAPPALPAEWTIMVFVNGKNSLDQFTLKDMNEMEIIGSSDRVNIVVEAGRTEGYSDTPGDWTGTRRYLIKKDTDTLKVTSPVVQYRGKVDMGDYRNAIDFGNWAKKTYPAKKYMFIMWNHGSGWEKGLKSLSNKGISYDDETGNHINTPQLGQILKGIGGVDVYGLDACLMQMAEVDYELKDYVSYIVGSEETEPGDGYTYNDFLGPVVRMPMMTPEQVGKVAVNAFSAHYQAVDKTASTQSLVKSAAISRLLTLSSDFVYAVALSGEKELAKSARDGALKFATAENKDLYDFTRLIVAGTKSTDVKTKGQALMTFITSELVMKNQTSNDLGNGESQPLDYSPAKGIAIYIPSGPVGDGYMDLQWAKYSKWDEFINWMNQP